MHMHTCISESEMNNCRVEYMVHECLVKFKLSCTVLSKEFFACGLKWFTTVLMIIVYHWATYLTFKDFMDF